MGCVEDGFDEALPGVVLAMMAKCREAKNESGEVIRLVCAVRADILARARVL